VVHVYDCRTVWVPIRMVSQQLGDVGHHGDGSKSRPKRV
jgi:hypothetical protein